MLKLNLRRLRWPWRSKEDIARDIDEEIAFHLDARTDELVRSGLEPAAARAQAEREFGDVEAAEHTLSASDARLERRRRRLTWFEDLRLDLRLAMRSFVRDPGFSGAVVVVLGFGIGLAVAMFAVFDAVLRRPLPVRDQDRVVALWMTAGENARKIPLTLALYEEFAADAQTLNGLAGTISDRAYPAIVRGQSGGEFPLNVAAVTGNFFDVLGTRPALGRTLRPDDDAAGAEPVAVISHGVWRRRFGSDPDVIGRRLEVPTQALTYTVVGVAPPGLEFPSRAEFWVPVVPFYTSGNAEVAFIEPIGRLARDATGVQAAAEMMAFVSNQDSPFFRDERLDAHAATLPDLVTGDVRSAVLILSGAAGLLLLIACINGANLLLLRASGRREEMAVRRALGAGRGRVLRQLLAESVVLAFGGGLLGSVLATALMRGFLALAPPELPRLEEIQLSGGVPLGLAATVTIAVVLAFGLAPSMWTSTDEGSSIRVAGRSGTVARGTRRAQRALVVLQVGLGVVVLAAGALLGRTLLHLERMDMGFDTDQLVMVQLNWPIAKYDDPAAMNALLYDRVIPRVEALPEVASTASVNAMPFAGASAGGWDGLFVAEGVTTDAGQLLNMEVVGPDFFQTLGVRLIRGRGFTDADEDGAPRVVVLNEAAARLFWPGEDPVGKRISLGQPQEVDDWRTVVGVAAGARYRALRELAPTVYLPDRQARGGPGLSMLAVRTTGTTGQPAGAVPAIRRAILDTDPDLLILAAAPMQRLVAQQLARPRLSAFLLAAFGAGAVTLAAVGLYAVLAFAVRQRAPELAIRQALGASPSRLQRLVVRQALAMAWLGVVLGLAGALVGGRMMESLLFGVKPADPLTLAGTAAVLFAVTLAASYVPARRAMRADPAAALQED